MSNNFGPWSYALYSGILAARLGREVLLKYSGKLEKIESKFQAGLVSEADRESEKEIIQFLRKKFPDDEFLGEESTNDLTKVESNSKGRWIIDPLDGTTNYIHRFPIYCISIGYQVDGDMKVAIIDVPVLGEVYTAVRGYGAYVNGQKISVSQTKKLSDSLLATGFLGDIEPSLEEQIKIFSSLVRETRGIRRPGAAAYDLCQVARGVFDGFWEKNLKPWDSAAGALLVEEAGGKVFSYRGKKYSPFQNSLIAGCPEIAKLIQEKVSHHLLPDTD